MKTQEIFDAICGKEWVYKTSIENAPQHHPALGKRGFTLIELIVVVAIIGILAMIAMPAFSVLKDRTRVATCKSDLGALDKKIVMYVVDNGQPPPDLSVLRINQNELLDPWGRPYVYYNIKLNGTTGAYIDPWVEKNSDYDLYSPGVDGITEKNLTKDPGPSMDDIVRIKDGGIIDLGTNF